MNDFIQALLHAANAIYPMRGVHTGWCTAGMFTYDRKIISFIIEGNRGTFRRVDIKDCENVWFDVIKTKSAFTAIVCEGVKYNINPTLF